MSSRFRGSYLLKIDDKSRIKVPARYHTIFESQFGKELYLTSLNGDRIYVYPLKVWERIESSIEKMRVRTPELEEFINRTSFWGSEAEIDNRGRILMPPELRESARLNDSIRVVGKIDHLVVWNDSLFRETALEGVFDEDKLQKVAMVLNGQDSRSGHE